MNPSFSIIIPLADNASPSQLKRCLNSLSQQTLPPSEIIIVTSKKANKALFQTLALFPQIKIFKKNLSKAAGRNFGAEKAQGNYLIHLDVDHSLDQQTLAKTANLVKDKKAKAVILSEKIKPLNFMTKIRALERQFNLYDPYVAAPRVIEAQLFRKIGVFDETVDMLDDWTIYFRLKRKKIKFFRAPSFLYVDELSTIKKTITHKYTRGQYFPLLYKKYPEVKQITTLKRLKTYLKHYKKIFQYPLVSVGLIFIKLFDWLLLTLGSFRPKNCNLYEQKTVAKEYDQIRTSANFQLYKNFTEENALKLLLKPKPKNALEIGCGTGRITEFLTLNGIKVFPTDPSKAMLRQFLKKKGLPQPIKIAAENLPLNLGRFDVVLGLRVIWHLKDRQKHLKIMQKSSCLSKNWVIFDFANREKYGNLLFYPFFRVYGFLFNPRFYKNDYFFTLKEITKLAQDSGLKIEKILPLDLLTPLWLNFLSKKTAGKLFSPLFKWELRLGKYIPPGRWLIKFKVV